MSAVPRPRIVPLWPDGSPHNPRNPMARPRLEVYLPEGGDTAPAAVIICPGGGYHFCAPHEAAPVAWMLARHGLAGLVCHYRVALHRHPAPYADVARAVRLVRSQGAAWGVDPERVALMGFSAGGHAAVTVATRPDLHRDPLDDLAASVSARPDRTILAYPVVSMVEDAHAGCLLNLLGEDPPDGLRADLSAERWVDADTPPVFLFHTAEDGAVSPRHSLRYAAACTRHGVPVALHLFPCGGHGVGLAEDDPVLRIWPTLMLAWLGEWVPAGARPPKGDPPRTWYA